MRHRRPAHASPVGRTLFAPSDRATFRPARCLSARSVPLRLVRPACQPGQVTFSQARLASRFRQPRRSSRESGAGRARREGEGARGAGLQMRSWLERCCEWRRGREERGCRRSHWRAVNETRESDFACARVVEQRRGRGADLCPLRWDGERRGERALRGGPRWWGCAAQDAHRLGLVRLAARMRTEYQPPRALHAIPNYARESCLPQQCQSRKPKCHSADSVLVTSPASNGGELRATRVRPMICARPRRVE